MTIPEYLVVDPCVPVGPGKYYKELELSYVANTTCIGKYAKVLNGIRTYNRKILEEDTGVADGDGKKR